LSVEFDSSENSETVYGRGRDRLLTVRYDASGRPVRAIPAGPLDGLNVTYDSRGRVSGWWRGSDLAVGNVYDDRTGLMVEQRLANKIRRRFIYKTGNKVLQQGRAQCFSLGRGETKGPMVEGMGMGMGFLGPHHVGDLEERCELPQRDSGRTPRPPKGSPLLKIKLFINYKRETYSLDI